jgi:hypothetical protein
VEHVNHCLRHNPPLSTYCGHSGLHRRTVTWSPDP